jgi:hypothetical protein
VSNQHLIPIPFSPAIFPTGVPAIVPVGEPGVIVANQAIPNYVRPSK